MFLQSYPELLDEPANEAMQRILELMKQGNLDRADEELNKLASILADLPMGVQMRISYDQACTHSMRASAFADHSREREQALDQAEKYLIDWFERGQSGGFRAIGRTADAEVHQMANDRDLSLVCSERGTNLRKAMPDERGTNLRKAIPNSYWPTRGGGGGCVPLGTFIDTPNGKCLVERLRPGDDVVSLRLGSANERVKATVVAVATERSVRCIQLNQSWLVTPSQPVRISTGWVEAALLKKGDRVMDGYGALVSIFALEILERYFEVFDLTIDDPCHNYVANGLLCHNKKLI